MTKYRSIRHFSMGILNLNWGDVLSSYLFEKLSGFKPEKLPMGGPLTSNDNPVLLMTGSIMSFVDSNTSIWGTGAISSEGNCKKPRQIYAVRGPLTRQWLLKRNFSCPEIYGDPALILPEIYKPQIQKTHVLGVIPHYVDQKHPWVLKAIKDPRVKFINILTGEEGITKFIDQVCSCEKILSSSLHGLICADAYGIPSFWVEFSNKVLGNGFKFRDYFKSVNRKEEKPLDFDSEMSIDTLLTKLYSYDLKFDVSKLLNSCPLIEKDL